MENKNLNYLISLPFLIILFKWIINFYYLNDLEIDLKILLNVNDIQYFPFIISLSDLNFSPSYNDFFKTEGVTSFPYASIITHSIFHKLFSLYGYVIAELMFYIFGYLFIYAFLKKAGISNLSALIVTFLIFFSHILLEFGGLFFF